MFMLGNKEQKYTIRTEMILFLEGQFPTSHIKIVFSLSANK
jgi:hypothetical protein